MTTPAAWVLACRAIPSTRRAWLDQVSCHLGYTNERVHAILRNNLERSPLYSGVIVGIGPRYCPSIEDKIVTFSDKEKHCFMEKENNPERNPGCFDYKA